MKALLIIAAFALSSCAALVPALTGEPVPTTPALAEDGTVFHVATTDLWRAKNKPGTAWGLYDAGMVAKRAHGVIDSGK